MPIQTFHHTQYILTTFNVERTPHDIVGVTLMYKCIRIRA